MPSCPQGEDRQTVAGGCVQTLLVKIQRNAGSSARFYKADKFGERTSHAVNAVQQHPFHRT